MSDEIERYTMRTNAVQDGIYMRAKCLVHADCRAAGKMVFPSGRTVHLTTKTGDIKDLNANFVKHLEKRDEADGTSHADTWRKGLIHGPQAPFTVPYDAQGAGDGGDDGSADGAMDTCDAQDNTLAIPLAAARTAATAVANVLAAARERERLAATDAAAATAMPRLDNRGRCNKKRKLPAGEND
jgi:hypothetical protein